MEEIIWTREAEIWMKEIYDFIALDDKQKASEVINGIYEEAQILRKHPQIGYRYRKEPEGQVRVLLYGHYRIAYLLTAKESIKVLGVYHGSLDIDRYF